MVDDDTGHATKLRAPPGAVTEPAATNVRADPSAPTVPGLTMNETLVPPRMTGPTIALPAPGYQFGDVIGKGGMGEVVAAHDKRIGREVAIKRMRAATPDQEQVERFLREARIQARLDHPAIVPVHELGIEDGRPYFTMKKLSGKTLSQRFNEGQPLNRLLRTFVEVCQAVEFAHSRGVVHRDLKPANIMVGEYGEVYVIDWGIARVVTDEHRTAPESIEIEPSETGPTQTGVLLGTPGYMAPEQIRGELASPAADVYALGSILFELLTREPLHPRGQASVGSTLGQPQQSPMLRAPDKHIPPELDASCQAALHEDPKRRPTAHELGEQVQQFLDGDRDVERRRKLAAEQLQSARDVLESNDPEARASAMRRAGRALALDPESTEAAELVGALLLEPPDPLPPQLAKDLEEHESQIGRDRSRKGVYAYLSVVAFAPVALVVDVENWAQFIIFFAMILLGMSVAWHASVTGRPSIPAIWVVNLAIVVMFTRIAGPFVLTPLAICCGLAAFTAIRWFIDRTWAVVGWTAAAVLLPIFLELVGVFPRTWAIRDDALLILGDMFETHGVVEEVLLTITCLVFTLVVALYGLAINRKRRQSQRALFIQTWHLKKLLPETRRSWITRPVSGRAATEPAAPAPAPAVPTAPRRAATEPTLVEGKRK